MEFLESQAQRDVAATKVEEARANVGLAEVDPKEYETLRANNRGHQWSFDQGGRVYHQGGARTEPCQDFSTRPDPCHRPSSGRQIFSAGRGTHKYTQVAERREFGLMLPTGDKYPLKGHLVAGTFEFNPATQTTEVIVEFLTQTIYCGLA